MKIRKRVILLDFDGTCVTNSYPNIEDIDIGSEKVLKELVDIGHKIILYTMRCDDKLEAAKKWFSDRGIKLWAVNNNPSQYKWATSKKVHGDLCIDDRNLGTPMTDSGYVDWSRVREILVGMGYLPGSIMK